MFKRKACKNTFVGQMLIMWHKNDYEICKISSESTQITKGKFLSFGIFCKWNIDYLESGIQRKALLKPNI